MNRYFSMAAVLVFILSLTGTVTGLSFQTPQPEEFEKYTNNSEKDIEEEIEEKVDVSSDSENVSIEEEIERKMEEKTREIKQERITGEATEKDSKGFFSSLIGLFG